MVITYISLVISSLIVISYFIFSLKSKNLDYLIEPLDDSKFKMKDIYLVGFVWEGLLSKTSFNIKKSRSVRENVILLYGDKYADYYTKVYLAQGYAYAHLVMSLFGIISAFTSGATSLLLLFMGIIVGLVLMINSFKAPKEDVEKRATNCIIDFPNMVTKLALLINSGMILRDAWLLVAENTQGDLRDLLKESCESMRNGVSDIDAIYDFGTKSGSKEIKKFASMIIQGSEKGNSELAGLLSQQASELWENKRQRLLQKGDIAATKLVIPTTLMFAGIILVVVSSSMTGMSI